MNKYLVSPFARHTYHISYDFKHKAIWFRVYKTGTRTIDHRLKNDSSGFEYIYSSEVGYLPSRYKDYFKFSFVRNPLTRFESCWKDKVLRQNYFNFNDKEWNKMKDLDYFIEWVKTLNISKCDEHLRSQSSLIDLENIDFVGKFENFEEDFRIVADKIRLGEYETNQLNSTTSSASKLTEENVKTLKQIYQVDFKNFYPHLL